MVLRSDSSQRCRIVEGGGGTMATRPGGSIVERKQSLGWFWEMAKCIWALVFAFRWRGENHPESQLPIIPDGSAGETSCRDQSQSTDVLCVNRLEPKHKIFLSHSGAQKSFVKQLCKDIERFDRYPFFDELRTSLPIGYDFPKAIFEAIGQCRVAVVVLSEDFFWRTKWPMLELSALVKRKGHDPDLVIMPVFVGLTREQCRVKANHDRWLLKWKEWAKKDQRIRLDEWMAVFKVFGYINSVSVIRGDEVKCREDVVAAVCKEVPAETLPDVSHVQGRSRICKTIVERIGDLELRKRYEVRVLGLYGVGGIGKSTACMTLCNHYFEEFHGRVCHVEFGVMDELHMLQEILMRLSDTNREHIERLNKEECQGRLKNIKSPKIFLAMDNVFQSNEILERAKLILRAGFASNSIVIVMARSLGELQELNIEESDCMEMPELLLDDAISLFVQGVSCDKSTDGHLIRQCVDRCYFKKGDRLNFHYHPLALRVLGGQLGSDSSKWLEKLEKMDVFNPHRERSNKHPIFSILRRSFDILTDEDKDLFMDCALFVPYYSLALRGDGDIYHWLSMIHGQGIKSGLNGLKCKSLIQSLGDGIGIHDLWREFCVMETKVGESKSRRWIYEGLRSSVHPCIEESNVHSGAWKRAQRISLIGSYWTPCNVHLNLIYCSNLLALHLQYVNLVGNALDLSGVYNLKSLIIKTKSEWKVCGLGSLWQLCLFECCGQMPSDMAAFIEEIGGLTSLQILNLSNSGSDVEMGSFGSDVATGSSGSDVETGNSGSDVETGNSGSDVKTGFPNLGGLSLLQRVAFDGLDGGESISFNSTMTNLQQLSLTNCFSLQKCDGICGLVELEELRICDCPELGELPNLQVFKNLKKLVIRDCDRIKTLMGVDNIATLVKLEAPDLVELPDLSKLTNLQVLDIRVCSSNREVTSSNRVVMGLSELINLQECMISIDGLGDSSDLQELTKLQVMNIYGWKPQGSLGVDSLVNLEDLCIDSCTHGHSLGGLSKLTRLCKLRLLNCSFKDVACLKDLLGLHEIHISGCNYLERFLDTHKATRLRILEITNSQNLRMEEGLGRKRAKSSRPYEVDFQSGGKFLSLQSLSFSLLPSLKLLDLSSFPNLEVLTVETCSCLMELTSSLPLTTLKHFEIQDCESLKTIPNLSSCKHLKWVSVQGSGVVLSEKEIEDLKVMCPRIEIPCQKSNILATLTNFRLLGLLVMRLWILI